MPRCPPHTLPILEDLPAGYFVEESPGGFLAVHIEVAREFHRLGYGPESDGPLEPSDLAGRGALYQLVAGEERFVVRRFHHGGVLRWVTGDRYAAAERPFRELIVSNAIARSGVRTPQVVAARARRAPGAGWLLELVTRRVEDSLDCGEALERVRAGRLSTPARRALFRSAGATVRELHRVGLLHADLSPRNLLVTEESLEQAQPKLWVLDLDRSAFVQQLSDGQRRDNLRRLLRAVLRRESRGQGFLGVVDFARFLGGYDPEGTLWKDDWLAVREDHRRARHWHSVGWLMERLLGSGPEKRDGKAAISSP